MSSQGVFAQQEIGPISKLKWRLGRFLSMIACLAFLAPAALYPQTSATLTVNTLNDQWDAANSCTTGGTCSLRDAVAQAPSGATIVFASNVTGTITLTQGSTPDGPAYAPFLINQNLTIQGPGANQLTLYGGGQFTPIFVIQSPLVVSISGLNMTYAAGTRLGIAGGAISNANSGTLTVSDCTIWWDEDENGGIYSNGVLTVNNTLFYHNELGIVNNGGTLTINGSDFDTNDQGVASTGTVTIANSIFTNNTDPQTYFGDPGGNNGGGGAIAFDGDSLTVSNSVFTGNGGTWGGAIETSASGNTTITGSTFSGNDGGYGGAIYVWQGPATIVQSTISGNQAGLVGGIYLADGNPGPLNVINSIVAGNSGFSICSWCMPPRADVPLDCQGCTAQSSMIGGNPLLSPLQLNGPVVTIQTMLPLPGSPAICAASPSLLPAGTTTDARGFPRLNTTYPGYTASAPCLDLGAAQTNYTSVQFVQQPTDTIFGQPISPAPIVEVLETNTNLSAPGNTDSVAGVPVTLALGGNGTLAGTVTQSTVQTTPTSTAATFPNLLADGVGSVTLVADLQITPEGVIPSISYEANSDPFNIPPTALPVTIGTSPAGLSFSVDGVAYTSQQSATWTTNQSHVLSVPTPQQSPSGGEYFFAGWSDGTSSPTDSFKYNGTSSYVASFMTEYQLNVASNNAAYGSVTPSVAGQYYAPGTVVTLTATPAPGEYFLGWTGSADIANSSSPNTTITMNNTETVTANFGLGYALALASLNSAGTVTATPAQQYYAPGTVVNLTATAIAPGYQFIGWAGSTDIANSSSPNTTITMNGPETVTGNFEFESTIIVAPNNLGYGTASVSPVAPYYQPGAVVTLTATAAPGYSFVNWTGSANISNPNSPTTTITINGPAEVTANFQPATGSGPRAVPTLVVTVNTDDQTPVAANCQAAGGAGSNCSLRDALAAAAAAGGGNISFSPTVFTATNTTAQNTITLGIGGPLPISGGTTITGLTTGSGSSQQNLVTISGNNTTGVISALLDAGSVAIYGLNIVNGNANQSDVYGGTFGGGILNLGDVLTVSNCAFSNNVASGYGGAIANLGGSLTVINSAFTSNSAPQNESGGGAIYSQGSLSVTGSTFSGNSAPEGFGGAIFASVQASVTDSTITGNSASISGGGLFFVGSQLTLASSTISGNTAGAGGGIENFIEGQPSPGVVVATNSIVAGNTSTATPGDDCDNCGAQGQYDLISTPGNITVPLLGPLQINGAGTMLQTMLPLPGSPAICAGSPALLPTGLIIDQRGFPRVNTTYPSYSASSPCLDLGAVQTNYSLQFVQQPTDTAVNQVISPAPSVEVLETNTYLHAPGNTDAVNGISLPLSLNGNGSLGGTLTASTTNGVVTFSNLTVSAAGTGDTLSATLPISPSGVFLQATSAPFDVTSPYSSNISLQLASTTLVYPGATNVTVCLTPSNATGTVSIYDGATLLTNQPLQGGGCAYWYISPGFNAGTHLISAIYSGDSNNPAGQSAPVTVTVSPAPVVVTSSCWNASFPYGGNYSCTVNVSSSAGGVVPGAIAYTLDNGPQVSVPLSSGNAEFTLTEPAAGNHTVVIAYAQQGNFAAAAPNTQTFTVTQVP